MDTLDAEPKKGDYFSSFGLYIEKEFSIVTKMGSGRMVDLVGEQTVIKTRSADQSQKWYFDYKSRTIINVKSKKSLSIGRNGSGKVVIWNTNSDWF